MRLWLCLLLWLTFTLVTLATRRGLRDRSGLPSVSPSPARQSSPRSDSRQSSVTRLGIQPHRQNEKNEKRLLDLTETILSQYKDFVSCLDLREAALFATYLSRISKAEKRENPLSNYLNVPPRMKEYPNFIISLFLTNVPESQRKHLIQNMLKAMIECPNLMHFGETDVDLVFLAFGKGWTEIGEMLLELNVKPINVEKTLHLAIEQNAWHSVEMIIDIVEHDHARVDNEEDGVNFDEPAHVYAALKDFFQSRENVELVAAQLENSLISGDYEHSSSIVNILSHYWPVSKLVTYLVGSWKHLLSQQNPFPALVTAILDNLAANEYTTDILFFLVPNNQWADFEFTANMASAAHTLAKSYIKASDRQKLGSAHAQQLSDYIQTQCLSLQFENQYSHLLDSSAPFYWDNKDYLMVFGASQDCIEISDKDDFTFSREEPQMIQRYNLVMSQFRDMLSVRFGQDLERQRQIYYTLVHFYDFEWDSLLVQRLEASPITEPELHRAWNRLTYQLTPLLD